ncbi:TatD family hydrolase [Treponema sp.]|uniref:TatD family hydrolase n=1 Tax=Treponema sp. TaxID=166 RepID=UPI003890A226
MYFDAHFHLVPAVEQCGLEKLLEFYRSENHAITCAHSVDEFEKQDSFIRDNNLEGVILQSFGIHPQLPLVSNAEYLEGLLKEKRIKLIGETGLDFFNEELKCKKTEQMEAFHICLELGLKYNVPLVIHNRKALDLMFTEIKSISKLPLVLFHSFAFSTREALNILKRNVNGVFSFSKQILNGNKKSISCLEELPMDRLFMETDAPFQTLKGEEFTLISDIKRVYEEGARIKKMSLEAFMEETGDNSKKLFFCF